MKTKKKLLIPIALLVLAVMAVTSTTFAWFTTNNVATGKITNARVSSTETMLYIVKDGVTSVSDLDNENNWGVTSTRAYPVTDALNMIDLTYTLASDLDATPAADKINSTNWTAENLSHGLYKKGVYGTSTTYTAGDLALTKATANVEYIDITYTFWCSVGTAPYKLYFNPAASNIISGTTTNNGLMKRGFNISDYNYWLKAFEDDTATPGSYVVTGTDAADADAIAAWTFVRDFYGVTTRPSTYIDDAAYIAAGFEVRTIGATKYYFNSSGYYETSAAYASRVLISSVAQADDQASTPGIINTTGAETPIGIWEPNSGAWDDGADVGYDTLNGSGVRNFKYDTQDMFNKAQIGGTDAPNVATNRYTSSTSPKLLDVGTKDSPNTIELLTFTQNNNYFKTDHSSGNDYMRAQVNLKVWLEGWDLDCFNVILNDILDMAFAFEAR